MRLTLLLIVSMLLSVIRTSGQCNADAGADVAICDGQSTTIGGSPTGNGGSTYSWSPAAGLNSTTDANPVANPSSTTTYTVTVTTPGGATCTDQVTVTVNPSPTASFTFAPSNQCASVPVNFTNTSTGSGLNYSWNFDNPAAATNSSSLQNPSHEFVAPGTGSESFNVTLTVTDANGCTDNNIQTVTVTQAPNPVLMDPFSDFKNCDGSGFTFTFFDNTQPTTNSNYQIIWGDGSPDFNSATFPGAGITHNYPPGNIYTLEYIVTGTNGCTNSTTYLVSNITNPAVGVANPGGTTGCGPLNLCFPISNFSGNHPSTIYTVDYGDGSPIDTFPHPVPASICHTYTESSCGGGTAYTFTIQAINACDQSTATVNPIRVYTGPEAHFDAAPVPACVNTPVTFTNTTIEGFNSSCSNTTFYTWDFGDGTVVNAFTNAAQTHTYTAPGTYNVTLTASNSCSTTSETNPICIEAAPVPDFTLTPTEGCAPLDVSTTNLTSAIDICDTTFSWTVQFNGSICNPTTGNYSYTNVTSQNSLEPEFEFIDPGEYIIVLTVNNSCGSFTHQDTVNVYTIPEVTLALIPDICAGQTITPTATYVDCDAPITDYSWTFPGGSPATSNVDVPGTITFANAGNPTITIEATNQCGVATASQAIVVSAAPALPTINSNTPVCEGDTIFLDANTVAGANYNWTGPNGFTSTLEDPFIPNVTAANSGNYDLVIDNNGCPSLPASTSVTVIPAPIVTVNPNPVTMCEGDTISLTASGATTYTWSPGTDISATSGANVDIYPTATTQYVVTGSDGTCESSTTVDVTVNPNPTVDAGPDITLCNQPVAEQLNGTPAGGTWSGPNITVGGQYTPAGNGVEEVYYSFTDGNGCSNEDTVQVTVVDPVPASVGNDTSVCLNSAVLSLVGNPVGGTWTGTNVTPAGDFTPSIIGTVTLTYTVGAGSCLSSADIDVSVLALPTVDAGNDTSVCIDGGILSLVGNPAGGTWSGTNITPTGDFDPMAAGFGTFTQTYTYTDPTTGCENSDDVDVTVIALPTANAGNDTTLCDLPSPVQFNGTPVGGTWSGPNVTAGGSFTPNGTGTFTLTYTYTIAGGCSVSDDVEVTVVAPQLADAGPDLETCFGTPVFNVGGTPAGGTWTGTNVAANGDYTASQAGTFTLTYSIGAGNCLTQDDMEIIVHALPVVDAGPDADFCATDAAVFFNGTPAGGTWSGNGIVDVNAGEFDPTVSGIGAHDIVYAYTDPTTNCVNTDTLVATVDPLPVPSFTHAPVTCIGFNELFTNTSVGGSNYSWTFGDGGTSALHDPTHSYGATGTYTIQVIATSGAGCIDSITSTIDVLEPPLANFTVLPDSGCGDLLVNFTDLSSGSNIAYAWDFGNGATDNTATPADQLYTAGVIADTTYYITLDVSNFCGSVQHTDSVIVMPTPTAEFGTNVNVGCSPFAFDFSNTSYGLPDSYYWDYGDGTTSTTNDSLFSHTYTTGNNPTNYTIMLVADNECGSDTAYHTITVLPNTVTAFFNADVTAGCEPLTVNFSQFSQGSTNFSWDFGDGNVSTLGSPTHTFANAGTYTVQLFADDGCSFDTTSIQITVHPSPFVDFISNPDSVCIDEEFTFTNLSVGLSNVSWNFDDGNTSTLTNPTHAYAASGIYNVTMIGTSATNGCVDSVTHPVVVSTNPVADFTFNPANGCIPLPVAFTNNSVNADFYQWSFGDGNTSGNQNPNHTYSQSGAFVIQLVASNLNGCTDTIEQIVNAFPLPQASFTISDDTICYTPGPVTFTNTSTGAISYAWDFGNGNTSAINSPTTNYTNVGQHIIELIAENQYGCLDTAYGMVEVFQRPVALFSVSSDTVCANSPVQLMDLSTFATQYYWEFGDGNTSNLPNPSHTYDSPGIYNVTLHVYGAGGCGDTLTMNSAVFVHPTPSADFTYTNVEVSGTYDGTIEFTNQSIGASDYEWSFGDGTGSTETHPIYRYNSSGIIEAQLIAYNEFGCSDTAFIPVDIEFFKGLYVPNAMHPGHHSFEVANFIPKGVGLDFYHIAVYDAWGNLLWESSALDNDGRPTEYWDGTFEGEEMPQDAYVWKVEATFRDNTLWQGKEYPNGQIRKSGTVTILK